MSLADELLDDLSMTGTTFTATPETEPHIVISTDRKVSVPLELRNVAVQHDHNIETVTFDCPRFWDGNDLSTMVIYINYRRSDGGLGCDLAKNLVVEDSIMHFDWCISKNATKAKGTLTFLICAKIADTEGNESIHWNSALNSEMFISEGLECTEQAANESADIIMDLLTRMDTVESITSEESMLGYVNQYLDDSPDVIMDHVTKVATSEVIGDKVNEYLNDNQPLITDQVVEVMTPEFIQPTINEYLDTNPDIIDEKVELYLESHPIVTDETLSLVGEAADAKSVGDAIKDIHERIIDVDALNEVSGTNLFIPDGTASEGADFKIYGRCDQKQYSGKNLLKNTATTQTRNGVTFTVNDDGSVTANGTATSDAHGVLTLNTNIAIKGGSYILSGCPAGGSVTTYYVQAFGTNAHNTGSAILDTGNGGVATFTEDDILTRIIMVVYKGTTVSNLKFYPMIRPTGTDEIYEPYVGGVASPNPDYPQDIKSVADGGWFDGELLQGAYAGVDGNWTLTGQYICNTNMMPCKANDKIKLEYAEITSQMLILFYDSNKNFISYVHSQSSNVLETTAIANACYFNFDIANPNGITPQTAKPITVTINGKYALIVKSKGKNLFVGLKGWYNINSNGVFTQSNGWLSTDYIACKPLENYTISLVGNGSVGMWCFYNKNKDLLSSLASTNKQTITIPQDCYYFTQYTHGTNTDIQIEYGDKVTEYEPYKEKTSYIPLNEPLRGIGNVSDERSLTEITRRFAEVVFDGSDDEGWAAHSVANWFLIKRPTGSINNLNTMCSHYTTNTSLNNVDYGFYVGGTYINFKNKDITSVDEWRAWLQANPITVVYELTEPVVEAIEPVNIVTYDGVTHISATDNPEMHVEYYCNSNIGHRLAETIKEMRAEHVELNDRIDESAMTLGAKIESSASKINEKIGAINETLGISKNILNVTRSYVDPVTSNGVTYCTDENGNWIFSGTATADMNIQVYGGLAVIRTDINESVIISGCPSGGSESTYYAYAYVNDVGKCIDTGDGYTYEVADGSTATISGYNIVIKSGTNVDGLIFQPMVRYVSAANGEYEPYRSTDKLTELEGSIVTVKDEINTIKDTQAVKTIYTNASGHLRAQLSGHVVELVAVSQPLTNLKTALDKLYSDGYAPTKRVTCACRYSGESPNNVGMLEFTGNIYWLYDVITSEVITDTSLKITFNALWMVS